MPIHLMLAGLFACVGVSTKPEVHPVAEPAPADPQEGRLRPHAGAVWEIQDGVWAGKIAYAFGLHHESPGPRRLDHLPGALSQPVLAVLATGARRTPSCTPAFEGRTTPGEPLFVEGRPETLNPASAATGASPGNRDLLVVVEPSPGVLTWTVDGATARARFAETSPLAIEGARAAGPVDANLEVRFVTESGPAIRPDRLVLLDGQLQPPSRPDGLFRARVAPGRHTLEALQEDWAGHAVLEVPEGGCVYREEELVNGAGLQAAWPEAEGEPLTLWFGVTARFPIERVASVRYTGVRPEDAGLDAVLTARFALRDGALVAADGQRLLEPLWEAVRERPPGEQVWLYVDAIGPRGHRMVGHLLVGEAPL